MTAVLLSIHVLGAIILIGPITVAASLFPRYARQATGAGGAPDAGAVAVLRALHRICRVYAVLAVAVPVFGVATAVQLGVLSDAWLLVSVALTLVAAGLLAAVIVPGQRLVLAALTDDDEHPAAAAGLPRLAMTTGIFALIWAIVVVLMIARPGSTTGV